MYRDKQLAAQCTATSEDRSLWAVPALSLAPSPRPRNEDVRRRTAPAGTALAPVTACSKSHKATSSGKVTVPEHTHTHSSLQSLCTPILGSWDSKIQILTITNPVICQKIRSLIKPYPLILTPSNQTISSIWHFYKCLQGFVFKSFQGHNICNVGNWVIL